MSAEMYFSRDGAQMGVPAEVVIFGPHSSIPRGYYEVHVQIPSRAASLTDGGVFKPADVLRSAVMDDFGNLVGVRT